MAILREIALEAADLDRDRKIQLRNEARSTLALFQACLPRCETDGFQKLLVEVSSESAVQPSFTKALGVGIVQINADLAPFFRMTPRQKKEFCLELVMKGVHWLVERGELNADPFLDAYRKVKELDFKNEWVFDKPKWNRPRSYKARAVCLHDLDAFRINLIVENAHGDEVARKEIVRERPSEYAFVQLLGKLSWKSADEVSFFDKRDREVGSLKLSA